MAKRPNGFFGWKQAVRAACFVVLCLQIGFVHAPFARRSTGEVAEINPLRKSFVVREDASRKPVLVRWNEETRLWIEPTRRNDRGRAFDASQIKTGAHVLIMFKKYSDHNLVTRVIRLAPREKIPEGGSSPTERAFPDTPENK